MQYKRKIYKRINLNIVLIKYRLGIIFYKTQNLIMQWFSSIKTKRRWKKLAFSIPIKR